MFTVMLLFVCTFSVQAKEAVSVSGLEYERMHGTFVCRRIFSGLL